MKLGASSSPGDRQARRLSIAVCVFLLLVAAAIAANHTVRATHGWYGLADRATGVPNGDFSYYVTAGAAWRAGLDPYLRRVAERPDSSGPRDERFSFYVYPPAALPFYGWLSTIDYESARGLWLGLGLAAFAAMTAVAAAAMRQRWLEVVTVVVLLAAVSNPLQYHIGRGQSDLLVCSLAVVAFLLYRRPGSWPSAVLLATAILLKTAPLFVLAAMVLYYRDLRLLAKTGACLAAGVALSLLVVGPGLYVEYLRDVTPSVSGAVHTVANQSSLRDWPDGALPQTLGAVGAIGFAALFFALGRERAARERRSVGGDGGTDGVLTSRSSWPARSELEVLLLAVTLMLLVSPVAWRSWFVWTIVPVAAVLVAELHEGRLGVTAGLSAAACLWSLRVYEWMVYDVDLGVGTVYQVSLLTAPQLWGSVVALGTLAAAIVTDDRRARADGSPGRPSAD